MFGQRVINSSISLESFRQLSADKRVVILYPWSNTQNIFLSYFLDTREDGFLYFRISEGESLSQWLRQLLSEFQSAMPKFGKHLAKALDGNSPADLGVALAKDLADVNNGDLVLYLDEIDRASHDNDAFVAFISAFVESIPPGVQLAVSSRVLSNQPWADFVANKVAVVLGANYRRSNLQFTVEDEPKPQVEVYAFGRGHVLVDGIEIETWDGALPRNLFFYFLDNPLTTRNEIFQIFWPNLGVKEATNVFHVTKRKITERISAVLDQEESCELTKYSSGFYMPSEKVVRHYDVNAFERAMEQALMSNDPHERKLLYRQAIELYKAPFLQTIDMPWVNQRRQGLQLMYADALIGLAHIYKEQNQSEAALGLFVRALKEVPQREDIHRAVMALYAEQGRTEDAVAQFDALNSYLRKTVKIKPSADTQALYESITNR